MYRVQQRRGSENMISLRVYYMDGPKLLLVARVSYFNKR